MVKRHTTKLKSIADGGGQQSRTRIDAPRNATVGCVTIRSSSFQHLAGDTKGGGKEESEDGRINEDVQTLINGR